MLQEPDPESLHELEAFADLPPDEKEEEIKRRELRKQADLQATEESRLCGGTLPYKNFLYIWVGRFYINLVLYWDLYLQQSVRTTVYRAYLQQSVGTTVMSESG